MKKSDIKCLAQHFMNASNMKTGHNLQIFHNSDFTKDLVQACCHEAKQAGIENIMLRDVNDPFFDIQFYMLNQNAEGQDTFSMILAPVKNLRDLFHTKTQKQAEEIYTRICTLDYRKMTEAMAPLGALMSQTENVRILGPNTDVSFKLEPIQAFYEMGIYNIPDGECFSAPQKHSLNGSVQFGPSQYEGFRFSSVHLQYKNGKVVSARAGNTAETKDLNKILDIDEGARYAGEFAIAINPYILEPTGHILLDEKIAGSFHIAQGQCLKEFAPNENLESAIHWDLVQIQRPDHGGGEIWFDGELIRKDGLFITPELEQLNPENLKMII